MVRVRVNAVDQLGSWLGLGIVHAIRSAVNGQESTTMWQFYEFQLRFSNEN